MWYTFTIFFFPFHHELHSSHPLYQNLFNSSNTTTEKRLFRRETRPTPRLIRLHPSQRLRFRCPFHRVSYGFRHGLYGVANHLQDLKISKPNSKGSPITHSFPPSVFRCLQGFWFSCKSCKAWRVRDASSCGGGRFCDFIIICVWFWMIFFAMVDLRKKSLQGFQYWERYIGSTAENQALHTPAMDPFDGFKIWVEFLWSQTTNKKFKLFWVQFFV